MKIMVLACALCAVICASASSAMASLTGNGQVYASNADSSLSTTAENAASIGYDANGAVLTANTSGGQASAELYQYFSIGLPPYTSYIIYPGQEITIPLTITYSGDAEITPGSQSQASTLIEVNSFTGNNFEFSQGCSSDNQYGCGATQTVTTPFDFTYAYLSYSNQLTTASSVELYMQVSASGANASAVLDPVIAFDPNGANANLFPNGVTITPLTSVNALSTISAAPEPAAWLLLMFGVGSMGAALRYRRAAIVFTT